MSNAKEEFLESVRARAVVRGGEFYFRVDDMPDVLRQSFESNLAIIGLEGFEVEGEGIRSRLDLIADYSDAWCDEWDRYRGQLLDLALEWVRRLPGNKELLVCPTFVEGGGDRDEVE